MDLSACPIVRKDELKTLPDFDKAEESGQAIARMATHLSSQDEHWCAQGDRLFEEGIADALFCSCSTTLLWWVASPIPFQDCQVSCRSLSRLPKDLIRRRRTP